MAPNRFIARATRLGRPPWYSQRSKSWVIGIGPPRPEHGPPGVDAPRAEGPDRRESAPAQLALEHLAGRVARQGVEEADGAGDLEPGELGPAVVEEGIGGGRRARA